MRLKQHRSRTVESNLRWRWLDYSLVASFFIWSWTIHDTQPFVWGWPFVFALYVWGNIYSVKNAYIEGYADGTIDSFAHNHRQRDGD